MTSYDNLDSKPKSIFKSEVNINAGKVSEVKCPTLLIIGSFDNAVIELYKQAAELISCEKTIKIVYAASHLFEELGKLEEVANISSEWFVQKLKE
mgnify:CR=1 FL=1